MSSRWCFVTRREQADNLLLQAINNMEHDPHGQVSLLRSLTMATIATAMLQQEALDSTIEMHIDDDDDLPPPSKGEQPW